MAPWVFLSEMSTNSEATGKTRLQQHTKPAITNEDIEPARFGPLVKNLRRTRKEHQY